MVNPTYTSPQQAPARTVAWPVPRPRRFTVALGLLASVGVAASSLRAAPPALLVPLTILWLLVFAVGALWLRGGPVVLTVAAAMVKAITAALIIWAITHPLGSLNAATGIWLLHVIRHRALGLSAVQPLDPAEYVHHLATLTARGLNAEPGPGTR
jgi:hypothetical protein